jgi:thiol-disulfide isomerase/thioredoxin
VSRLSDVAQQIMTLSPEDMHAEEQYESLVAKYNEILSTAITDNLDNIIGVELFTTQESRSMTAEDMRVRLNQFSPKMRALKPMREFERYIETYARSEVGQPFIDVEVQSITGEKILLSEICGKGKWVLLDFWATWCDPCLQELPTLQDAYNRYALKDFEICSISLDREVERWRAFVAQNKLLWSHCIDFTDGSHPSATEVYGLQTIPANFLISPDGEIVARNLHGEYLLHELEHRLEKYSEQ